MASASYSVNSIPAQSKDGFLWGLKTGTTPAATAWVRAADEDFNIPVEGFTTMIAGRKHTKFKATTPPESWERLRSYVSFYTSGFKDTGYVQDVKLKMYVQNAVAVTSDTNSPASFLPYFRDWLLTVYTVSGGYHALHQEYLPGDNPSQYGFGDALSYFDAGEGDFVSDFDDWGNWANDPTENVLDLHVVSGLFSELRDNATSYTAVSADADGDVYRWRGWITMNIPIERINTVGETHFKLVHWDEQRNNAVDVGPGGTWNHHEYMTIETSETSRSPSLEVTYVTPGTSPISTLRLTDLSVHRHIETRVGTDPTYSGLRVIDGFPNDFKTGLDQDRNVTLEHVSSRSETLEIGSKRAEDVRRFFIDIVCDKRGEVQDLYEKIQGILGGSTKLKDFRYGFGNPPDIGNIHFQNVKGFVLPNIIEPNRERYHAVVQVDAHVVRSG